MTRTATVIGAPTDFGANRRGVDMGPSAIRYAGLAEELKRAGIDCEDVGNATGGLGDQITTGASEDSAPLAMIRSITEELAATIRRHDAPDQIPLMLGGDHSIALGSLHGVGRDDPLGVIWFDAHGDYNTPETSPSGHVHGMVLAAALGVGPFAEREWVKVPELRPENVVLVGTRDLDPREAEALEQSELTVMTMADIDRHGIASVCERAVEQASDGVSDVHVSLDLDWLDPLEAPGVGTPVRGGASYREAHLAMEIIADRLVAPGLLRSMDLVEVNPIRDRVNETAALATELAASAFGKRIL